MNSDGTVFVWDAGSHQQIGTGKVRAGSSTPLGRREPQQDEFPIPNRRLRRCQLYAPPGPGGNPAASGQECGRPPCREPEFQERLTRGRSGEGRSKVWDLTQKPPTFTAITAQHTGNVTAIGWSGDGTRLASADSVEIHVSDKTGKSQGRRIAVPSPTLGLSFFSKNKNALDSAHDDGYGRIWDLSQARRPEHDQGRDPERRRERHGKRFATWDGTSIQFWSASGDKDTTTAGTVNPGGVITTFALSQDGAGVAFILKSDDPLNFVTATKTGVAAACAGCRCSWLRIETTGTAATAAVADKKGKISRYPFDTSKSDNVAPVDVTDVASPVSALTFHPKDGNQVFFADPKHHVVKQFFIDNSKPPVSFDVSSSDSNIVLAISSDGTRLAAGTDKNILKIWSIAMPGTAIMTVDLGRPIGSVGLSDDGGRLITVGDDKTITLWDVAAKQRLENFHAFDNSAATPLTAAVVSSGAESSRPGPMECAPWMPAAKAILDPNNAGTVKPANAIAIDDSDTSAVIAYGGGKNALLYDIASKKVSATLGHSQAVNTVIFEPTKGIFITGSDDKQIKPGDRQAVPWTP